MTTDAPEFQWQPYLNYAQVFATTTDLPTLRSWAQIAKADPEVNPRTWAVLKLAAVRNAKRIEATKP
jgi:hypothetical protein